MRFLKKLGKFSKIFYNEETENITAISGMLIGIIFVFCIGILAWLCLSGICDMLSAIFMMDGFSASKFFTGLGKFSVGAGLPCGLMAWGDMN